MIAHAENEVMRVVSLDAFKESLVEELGNKVAFTVPVLGGVPVAESVVVTWIVMAALIALALGADPVGSAWTAPARSSARWSGRWSSSTASSRPT